MATTKKQAESQPEKKSGSAPVKVFRKRGVKVAVFENESETDGRKGKFYKVTVQKIYKEGADFKTTNSLGRDDIPVAQHLMELAWCWIMDAEDIAKASASRSEEEDNDQGAK